MPLKSLSYIFLIMLLIGISSCKCGHPGQAETLPTEIPENDEKFNQEMATILEDYIPELPAQNSDETKYCNWEAIVKEIYKANNYQPIWVSRNILSKSGKQLYEIANTAEYLGLNKELYQLKPLNKLYDSLSTTAPVINYELAKELETGLTRVFCQLALHLDKGMFADSTEGIRSNFWTSGEKYPDLAAAIFHGGAVDSALHSLEPDNAIYLRYMRALKEFVSKNNISSEPIYIRDPKKDSLGADADARKALVIHHYLPDTLQHNDSAFRASLKQFQRDNGLNPDAKIGMMTQKALERDNSQKFQLLAINADRWRRKDYRIPGRYVWVNLPSCKLRIIENDSMKMEKNVVIGKADREHSTPTLESGINQIILWPTWTVPSSIVKKELKSFKGFDVVEQDGYTKVIQPPGINNSLGAVKIVFPNKYSVYLHDTPAKYLFKSDYRAQSHGCVRCQDPLEVAAYLLQMDTFHFSYDSLLAIKESKIATRSFRLKNPVPLFFNYFTAEADWNGKLNYYPDIYKKDKEMLAFIFGNKKPVPVKTVTPPVLKKDSSKMSASGPVKTTSKDTSTTPKDSLNN